MEITGKIEVITEAQVGATADGSEWAKRTIVVSDEVGQYPNKLVMTLFKKGEYLKCATTDFNFAIGDNVKIEYSVRANEYKEKWYGDNSIFRIEKVDGAGVTESVTTESDLPF